MLKDAHFQDLYVTDFRKQGTIDSTLPSPGIMELGF